MAYWTHDHVVYGCTTEAREGPSHIHLFLPSSVPSINLIIESLQGHLPLA